MNSVKRFAGKTAVISGTASGVGRATAKLFASEGANVIGIARREAEQKALADEIAADGGVFVPYIGDVTKLDDVNGVIDTAVSKFGSIDILVNNAGKLDMAYVCDVISNEMWDGVIALNLTAPMRMIRKALGYMLEQENGGCIVNVGSCSSLRGATGGVAYTASKHGLVGLTKNVAYYYAKKGIRCNLVAPGGIDTIMCDQDFLATGYPPGRAMNKAVCSMMVRRAEPDEIASVIAYLCSDDASVVNGAIVAADSGFSAS